jgi:hypothetical protein
MLETVRLLAREVVLRPPVTIGVLSSVHLRVSIAIRPGKLAGPPMSAMPRKRRLAVKASPVAMGSEICQPAAASRPRAGTIRSCCGRPSIRTDIRLVWLAHRGGAFPRSVTRFSPSACAVPARRARARPGRGSRRCDLRQSWQPRIPPLSGCCVAAAQL